MPVDPLAIFTSTATTLGPQLLTVGGVAIGVSASLLVLKKGWGFFTKLIKA